MKLSSKLAELRKKKGISEDQLATYLGVSWKDVTHWESGKAEPPLSMIPRLAAYYKVTTDELLSMDEYTFDTMIAAYLEKYQHYVAEGMLPEAIAVMRDGLIHFPGNYKLKCMLMYALYLSCTRPAVVKHYTGEIFALGNEILEGCTDDTIRLEAKRVLCLHCFDDLKDPSSAMNIAKTLPSRSSCREDMIAHVSVGERRSAAQKQNLLAYTQLLVRGIVDRALAEEDKQPELLKAALAILDEICPDGDYLSTTLDRMYIYKQMGLNFLKNGNSDDGFTALETAAQLAKIYDTLPVRSVHTSPLLSGIPYVKGISDPPQVGDGKTASASLLEALMVLDTMEHLRYDTRLKTIIQILTT